MINFEKAQRPEYAAAIAELKTARNVEEWNEKREKHRHNLTAAELAAIDSSGLITATLGTDKK